VALLAFQRGCMRQVPEYVQVLLSAATAQLSLCPAGGAPPPTPTPAPTPYALPPPPARLPARPPPPAPAGSATGRAECADLMSEEGLQALSDACPETEMAAGEAPGRCDTVPERAR
jgi:hypothetical protein